MRKERSRSDSGNSLQWVTPVHSGGGHPESSGYSTCPESPVRRWTGISTANPEVTAVNVTSAHLLKHLATITMFVNATTMTFANACGDEITFGIALFGAGFAGYARIFFVEEIQHMRTFGYRHVAMELRYMIATQELPTGALLPGQRELAKQYGVSRKTIIHALQLLEEEGLVDVFHGKGSYVAGPDPVDRITRAGHIETHILHNAHLRLPIDKAESLAVTWSLSPSTVRRVLSRLQDQGIIRRRRDGRYEAA